MKTLLLVALVVTGCGNKSGGASACADAITKGVDTMMAAGAKRMEAMGQQGAEMKAKMDEAAVKLKGVITNRCTEDKWSSEVIDCYAKATTREDLKGCRAKLPAEQSAKLQSEELEVMRSMMGGMGGMRGPHGGMGGPGMGSGATPPQGPGGMGGMGSGGPPPAPTGSAGSAK